MMKGQEKSDLERLLVEWTCFIEKKAQEDVMTKGQSRSANIHLKIGIGSQNDDNCQARSPFIFFIDSEEKWRGE